MYIDGIGYLFKDFLKLIFGFVGYWFNVGEDELFGGGLDVG